MNTDLLQACHLSGQMSADQSQQHYEAGELRKPTPKERAAMSFWGDLVPEMDDDEISIGGKFFLFACGMVAACLLVALVVTK